MVRVLFSGLEELPLNTVQALLFKRHIHLQLDKINDRIHDFSVCYVTFSRKASHVLADVVLAHSGGAVYGHGDNANCKLAVEHALAQVRANMRRRISTFDQAELSPF